MSRAPRLSVAGSALRPRLQADWVRLRDSTPAIVQIVIAATVSYLLAQALLHQSVPLIAALLPISSLGFVGDARPVRVLETAVAMTLGIALAELLQLWLGGAIWVFALALTITLALARFVSPKAAFALSAAVQCSLVMLSPPALGGPFIRSVDALIGGAVAVLATALLPRNPWGAASRGGRRVLDAHVGVLGDLAQALERGDSQLATEALVRARGTSALMESWRDSVDSGTAIARVSPFYWRRRSEFDRLVGMVGPVDLATRNLRVLARRAEYLVLQGRIEPRIAAIARQLATAIDLLSASIDDYTAMPTARHALLELAKHLDASEVLGVDASALEDSVVYAVRPYVIDALVATGMSLDNARASLAALD